MGMRQVIRLERAAIEVEERNGYLFLVETGQLLSVGEVAAYADALQRLIVKTGIDRAVIDARGEEGDPDPEVRAAMWDWLCAPDRGFAKIAFVLVSEMAIARVNMTALSRRAPVRAFDNIQGATRWVMRQGGSGSTLSMGAVKEGRASTRSDVPEAHAPTEPPPPPGPPRARSAIRPSPGFRPPTPGPSETASGPSRAKAPAGERNRDTTPPEGGQVA